MEVSIVFICLFIVVFGIFYLYYNTRNKERLALIEKDKDVSVFFSKKVSKSSMVWKIVILNLGLIAIGIGAGILMGSLLYHSTNMDEEVAISASIFLMSGIGLLVGFFLTSKMDKEE